MPLPKNGLCIALYNIKGRARQIETEIISNEVISLIIGKEMDFTCASRGISRRAGDVILEKSRATHVSTDSEWPIIIKYLTEFSIGYIQVEGLEFESLFRVPERVEEAGGWLDELVHLGPVDGHMISLISSDY